MFLSNVPFSFKSFQYLTHTILFFIFNSSTFAQNNIERHLVEAWQTATGEPRIAIQALQEAQLLATKNKADFAKYKSVEVLFDILNDSLPQEHTFILASTIAKNARPSNESALYSNPIFILYDISIDTDIERIKQHAGNWEALGFKNKTQQAYLNYHLAKCLIIKRKATSLSLEIYWDVLRHAEEQQDALLTFNTIRDIASIFGRVKNHQKSIDYYNRLLMDYLEKPDEYGKLHRYLEGDIYYRIGRQHLYAGSFEKAIPYLNKSIPLIIERKKSVAALAMRSKASAYENLTNYDSALYFYEEAADLLHSINSKSNYFGTLDKIANIYSLKEDYSTSNKLLWENITRWKTTHNKGAIEYNYLGLGKNHKALGNLDSAELFLSSFLGGISKKHKYLAEAAHLLSEVYEENKNPNQALKFYKLYKAYHDSSDVSANRRELMLAENRNILDEKQQELAYIQTEQQNQKYISYATGIAALFLLGFAITITISLKQKKRDHEKLLVQHREITSQNSEIHAQNEELHQQAEELQMQRDYLDSQKNETEKAYEILNQKNESIEASIATALTIQEAILPRYEFLKKLFSEHFVIYRPKDIVSGDFYWIETVENRTFVAVVDCTGHGVPGAFMSLIGFSLLNRIIKERKVYQPSAILEELDKAVKNVLKKKKVMNLNGMDMSIICLEPSNMTEKRNITYAGAKNNIYFREKDQNSLQELQATRRGIGGSYSTKTTFKETTYTISEGSTIYMYTDGYSDQNNYKRKRLGKKTLKEKLEVIYEQPLEEQGTILEKILDDFMQNEPLRDDITLLGLKI